MIQDDAVQKFHWFKLQRVLEILGVFFLLARLVYSVGIAGLIKLIGLNRLQLYVHRADLRLEVLRKIIKGEKKPVFTHMV